MQGTTQQRRGDPRALPSTSPFSTAATSIAAVNGSFTDITPGGLTDGRRSSEHGERFDYHGDAGAARNGLRSLRSNVEGMDAATAQIKQPPRSDHGHAKRPAVAWYAGGDEGLAIGEGDGGAADSTTNGHAGYFSQHQKIIPPSERRSLAPPTDGDGSRRQIAPEDRLQQARSASAHARLKAQQLQQEQHRRLQVLMAEHRGGGTSAASLVRSAEPRRVTMEDAPRHHRLPPANRSADGVANRHRQHEGSRDEGDDRAGEHDEGRDVERASDDDDGDSAFPPFTVAAAPLSGKSSGRSLGGIVFRDSGRPQPSSPPAKASPGHSAKSRAFGGGLSQSPPGASVEEASYRGGATQRGPSQSSSDRVVDAEVGAELRYWLPELSPSFACSPDDCVLLLQAVRRECAWGQGRIGDAQRLAEADAQRLADAELENKLLHAKLERKEGEIDKLKGDVGEARQRLLAAEAQSKQSMAVLSHKREECRKQLLLEEGKNTKLSFQVKTLQTEIDRLKQRLHSAIGGPR